MIRRDEILEKAATVPALPASALRVMELANDPETPINEFRMAIEYDPGLTSNLLRIGQLGLLSGRDRDQLHPRRHRAAWHKNHRPNGAGCGHRTAGAPADTRL